MIPGLPALEVSDLPSFVVDQDKVPGALELLVGQFEGVEDSPFLFVNSVYELEENLDYVNSITTTFKTSQD